MNRIAIRIDTDMSQENRLKRLASNGVGGDQILFAEITASEITQLDEMMAEMGFRPVNGLDDLLNTIRNGRPLGKKKQRFIDNLLKSFRSCSGYSPEGYAEGLSSVMERTLRTMEQLVDKVDVDDPVKFHSEHLLDLMDNEEMMHFLRDQTAGTRRIIELRKVGRPELALPALKDQFILQFEKLYKGVHKQICSLFKGVVNDRKELNDIIEEILSMNRTYDYKGVKKSDLRCMRNLFAHPDRIDYYDHYHLEFDDGTSLDIDAEGLIKISAIMMAKIGLMQFISRVLLNLRLYEIIIEK